MTKHGKIGTQKLCRRKMPTHHEYYGHTNFAINMDVTFNLVTFCLDFQAKSHLRRTMYSEYDTVDLWRWICREYFGSDIDPPDIKAVNDKYYGLDIINRIDRVLYVNGDLDPWHWLGINPDSLNSKIVSKYDDSIIFIPGSSHCKDLYVPNGLHPELDAAYVRIVETWAKWLK